MKLNNGSHIPHLKTIGDFYEQLQIGTPQGEEFSMMRIEEQPDTKRLEMPLFRCDFYRLVFIRSEGVQWLLPEQQFSSTENCIYFAHPGKLESWKSIPGVKGYLVCFTKEFFQKICPVPADFPFFTFEKSRLLSLDKGEAEVLVHQQEEMLQEFSGNLPDSNDMISALLWRLLIAVKRMFVNAENQIPENSRNDFLTYQKFRQELNEYFADLAAGKIDKHPTVSTIAEKVFLNPSYLNTVIKNVTGKTASVVIQEKTILEAKSYLMHTDLQITEIAYRLGFDDASYFNRLFKKWTSKSPTAFKKSISG